LGLDDFVEGHVIFLQILIVNLRIGNLHLADFLFKYRLSQYLDHLMEKIIEKLLVFHFDSIATKNVKER
jgi:hypothetical protein